MDVLTVLTLIQLMVLHSIQGCIDSVDMEQNTFNTCIFNCYLQVQHEYN